MNVSSVRSSPSSLSRLPAQESAAIRAPSLPGSVDASASGQKVGAKGSPMMDALNQDGFDVGGAGKTEELGKLMERALSLLGNIIQMLQQTVAKGAQGAQGGAGDSSSSDCFSPASAAKSPLSLDSGSLPQDPAAMQDPTAEMEQVPTLE